METKETLAVMDTIHLSTATISSSWQKPDNTTACYSTASSRTLWYKVAMSLPKTPR